MTFGKFRKALRVTKQRLASSDLRQNLALRPTRKSGGAEYVRLLTTRIETRLVLHLAKPATSERRRSDVTG
jgi:hypothetical protein